MMQKEKAITLTKAEAKDAFELASKLILIPKELRDYVDGIVDGAVKVEEALKKELDKKGA